MKKLKTINFLLLALSVFVFSGCDVPDSSYAKIDTDPNSVASDDSIPSADTSRNTDTEAERMEVTDGYVKGFDASYVDYYETDQGLKYYDTDGTQKDFFTILKKHGVNTVRLRIWVDPENAVANGVVSGDDSWTASGMNTLERTLRLAKRAKDNNLKVMLDFHYSDYWTDPGKQVIPYSWQSITTANAMAEKISDYTKEVLNAMKDADVLPDYVQVGNEVDSGLLLHTSYNGSSATAASSTVKGTGDNFSKYLKAGCDAVREISQDIKIIIHVTNRKPLQILTKSISDSLDYDIVGLSYYPWEDSHGTISSLRDNVTAFRNTYGKEVMVVESSMYWNYGAYDSNYKDLSYAAAHLIDPDTGEIYSDLTTAAVTYNASETTIIEGSLANQENTFRHIGEESYECGAGGICAWGGDMRGEWKYAFFTYEGKAMSSLDFFKNYSPE